MAIKLESTKSDLAAENDGAWRDGPLEWPGVEFHVRSINYQPYVIERNAVIQRMRRQYGKKPIPDLESGVEIGRLLAKHILLNWKGFDKPYSASLAREQLTDPASRKLRDAVVLAAAEVGEQLAEFEEEVEGN